MKRVFICIIVGIVLFSFCFRDGYADDKTTRDRRTQRALEQTEMLEEQRKRIERQKNTTRPILPPVVSPSGGVAPTPSPHIAVPPVTQTPIKTYSVPTGSHVPATTIDNVPSVPTQVTIPVTTPLDSLPKIPMVGSFLGKIVNIGPKEDAVSWIEVKDEATDRMMKIKVVPEGTPLIKDGAKLNFEGLEVGDITEVIFKEEGTEFTANFVNILSVEELEAMEEKRRALESESNVEVEKEIVPSP